MNFIEDVLERFPSAQPALLAIDEAGERRTWGFGELVARSAGLAGAMAARGVGRGDVVVTLVGNRPEWVLAMLACFRIGAVALPCNTQLRGKDLELRVRIAEPKLAIGEAELLAALPEGVPTMDLDEVAAVLDEERPQEPPADAVDLDPGDPALIVFTSGTTGEARAAVHSQAYLGGQRLQAENWFGAREGELAWCTAASGWSKSARNAFIAPWLCGATALIHAGRFDPAERLEICEREGVNVLCQAPTEYRMLAKRTELRPIPGLRRLVSAGEPLNPEVIRAFREGTGLDIHDGYGQTETGALTGSVVGEERVRPGSMGKPLPGVELRIVEGELQLRHASCPTFFSHYIGSAPFAEEWWRTGDLVSEDEDGYLWFEGRADDVIVSSGYRIGPSSGIGWFLIRPWQAAAVSTPDPERGAVVRAVVVLRDRERAKPARPRPRSTSAPRPPPTSTRGSSSSPTSCPRPPAARSAARAPRGAARRDRSGAATCSCRRASSRRLFSVTFLTMLSVGSTLPIMPRYVREPIGAGDLAAGDRHRRLHHRPRLQAAGGDRSPSRWRPVVVFGALLIVRQRLYFDPAGVAGLVRRLLWRRDGLHGGSSLDRRHRPGRAPRADHRHSTAWRSGRPLVRRADRGGAAARGKLRARLGACVRHP